MKVTLLSLGCKVNQAEISSMESSLLERGHNVVGLKDMPEICIINTCSVTAKSDYQSRQLIRRAWRAGARVMVTGCYSELNKKQVAAMEGVEAVFENNNKGNIIRALLPMLECDTLNNKGSRARKAIKVQDGCDFSCSYCLIWKARGRSRSVDPERVISEVDDAVSRGTREIVLAGIHLGLYGLDLAPEMTFSSLVEGILKKTEVERVRLSSLEINEIDERLMELLKDNRVCSHLHIPLQSGDNGVLGHMNRNYDASYFEDRLGEICAALNGIAIGTDIIAGFPTETGEAFENTCSLAKRLPFTYIHVFPYSRRPGTEAAEMHDMVGAANIKERATVLRGISLEKKHEYMKKQVGKTLGILLEEEKQAGIWRGTSDNYLKVTVKWPSGLRGSIAPVRVTGIEEDGLAGTPALNH